MSDFISSRAHEKSCDRMIVIGAEAGIVFILAGLHDPLDGGVNEVKPGAQGIVIGLSQAAKGNGLEDDRESLAGELLDRRLVIGSDLLVPNRDACGRNRMKI